jgi:hypothetical protein
MLLQTKVEFQWTAWRYIPEDETLHNYQCESLRSYNQENVEERGLLNASQFGLRAHHSTLQCIRLALLLAREDFLHV